MAPDELGGRVNHDIRPVLDGPEQIGGGEGAVHHQGDAMGMGDIGHRLYVDQIGVGIAQGLDENGLGVGANGRSEGAGLIRVHKGGGNAVVGQRMGQQIVAAAIDGFGRYDVVAGKGQIL